MEELRIEANGNLGPIDSSRIPRYAGAATYARLPRLDQVAKSDITVVGVPFDSGVSYRPGARFGADSDFTHIAKLLEEWAGVEIKG